LNDRQERCSFSSDVWAYGCVLLEIITKKWPWEEEYRSNAALIDAFCDDGNAAIFQEICYKQKAPENFRKILRACCTWSKYNRPNFTKIIQDFHHTSNTDHEFRNVTSNKTGMSHFQRQSSAQSRPQTSLRKNNHQL
jgi:serine/threonine protein kinase